MEFATSSIVLLSAVFAILLAIVHIFSGNLHVLGTTPRSRWLSFGSGISVAYVFVHILPELNKYQNTIRNSTAAELAFLEHHVYLLALLGLAVFYGLERVANESRQHNQKTGDGNMTTAGVFWVHIASFSVYNALIGYLLLHREQTGLLSLLFFTGAMGVHFVVNDYGLREHHKQRYHRIGRWLLAAAIIIGWVIGSATEIHGAAIAVLFAFIAGGVVLNVLKEELPKERESRFWAFALGAIVYSILLLII